MRTSLTSVVALAVTALTATFANAAMNRDSAVLSSLTKGAESPFAKNGTVPAAVGGAEAVVSVNLAGFKTYDAGFPGALNSRLIVPVSPSAQITGVSFDNLSIQLSNGSWGEEFTLSTNDSVNSGAAGTFWDYRPFDGAEDVPSLLGPISGAFTAPSNQFNSGPFSLLADGNLYLYVYESFNDAGSAIDAEVISGTLNITYAIAPEPTTLGALAGVAMLAARRRK